MANKEKTIYKDKKILYESYSVEKGIFVITISWWQDVPDDYDNYNKFKKKILHDKWLDSNSQFFPLVLKIVQEEKAPITKSVRKKKQQRFFTDLQVILQLREPAVARYGSERGKKYKDKVIQLVTFKNNLATVQPQIEKWVDMMFDCDYAPVTHTKKKGAD